MKLATLYKVVSSKRYVIPRLAEFLFIKLALLVMCRLIMMQLTNCTVVQQN